MKFEPIVLPTRGMALDIATILLSMRLEVELLAELISPQLKTEYEKAAFNGQIGQIGITCSEGVISILSNNEVKNVRASVHSESIICERWRSELGNHKAESASLIGTYIRGKAFQICEDQQLAVRILMAADDLDDQLGVCLRLLSRTRVSRDSKRSFRLFAGTLHSMILGLCITLYIDHPELIPDADWLELVNHSKSQMEKGTR